MNCCDEYCTNYDCNQGRDCPARVAKAKRSPVRYRRSALDEYLKAGAA